MPSLNSVSGMSSSLCFSTNQNFQTQTTQTVYRYTIRVFIHSTNMRVASLWLWRSHAIGF